MDMLKKLTLKCTVTGKEVTYTSAEYIAKRIAKAGSLENLLATYVSREANKVTKKHKTVKQTDKTFNGRRILDDTPKNVPLGSNWKTKEARPEGDKIVFYTDGIKTGEMKRDIPLGRADSDKEQR